MKATLFLTVFIILACLQGNAQLKGFSIGPYAEMIWPMGDLQQTNSNGIGAGVNADIRIGKLGLTASAGILHLGGKNFAGSEGMIKGKAVNAIPIRAGLKYRFVPALYLKLEGGVARYINDNGSAVIVSPGIGVRILGLDVQAKYETWINNGSAWGLKIGYNF